MSSPRREREREAVRRQITDAARRLFTTEGYAHVTMRRIAEAVEYTPGAIYSYFTDKDAIFHALHAQGFEELGRRMRTALERESDPLERLRHMGTAYTAFARANPELYDLMFVAQAPARAMDETWPEGARIYELVRAEVRRALDAGRITPGDPEAIAFLLWSSVHGMVTLDVRGRTKVVAEGERDRIADAAYQQLVDMLSVPGAGRARPATPAATPAAHRGRRRPRRSLPEA